MLPAARGWTAPKPVPRRWGARRWGPGAGRSAGGGSTGRRWSARRPRKKLSRKQFWLIAALLAMFALIQTMIFLDKELRGPLMFLAQIRLKQMATEAINTAITQEIARTAEADRMIRWKLDESGKVTGFLLDFQEQMRLTSRTIQVVERVLKEQEAVPERIPIGHALNSPLLSSFGPSVAVTLHPASSVQAEVDTRESNAGINMVLVEVFIRIRTEIAVVIPFDQAPQPLETEIPLSYAMVVGDVPMYYYDGSGNPTGSGAAGAPSITLPAPPASSPSQSSSSSPSQPPSGTSSHATS